MLTYSALWHSTLMYAAAVLRSNDFYAKLELVFPPYFHLSLSICRYHLLPVKEPVWLAEATALGVWLHPIGQICPSPPNHRRLRKNKIVKCNCLRFHAVRVTYLGALYV